MTAIAHGRGRGATDRMLRTAARGAALIGIAVVIGIVLLQVVDEGGSVGGPEPSGNGANRTTTSSASKVDPPQEVSVLVLNGSGVPQAATTKAAVLRGQGYPIVAAENAPAQQTGTTVACRQGYDDEAQVLLRAIQVTGATVAPFPTPEPASAQSAKCIVTLGK